MGAPKGNTVCERLFGKIERRKVLPNEAEAVFDGQIVAIDLQLPEMTGLQRIGKTKFDFWA
jgi:hypothetical protein